MNYLDIARKRMRDMRDKRITSVIFMDVIAGMDGNIYFRDTTFWINYPVSNERDRHFAERDRRDAIASSKIVDYDNVRYYCCTDLNQETVEKCIRAYHGAKKHGNIRVYRLD